MTEQESGRYPVLDMKKLHDARMTVYAPKSPGTTPLLSADGNTRLMDKDVILKRWAEHFDSVLNRPSTIKDNAINKVSQVECNELLDEFSLKQRKQFSFCHHARPLVQTQYTGIYKAGGKLAAEELTDTACG